MSKCRFQYSALILAVSVLLVGTVRAEDVSAEAEIEGILAGKWDVRFDEGSTDVMTITIFGRATLEKYLFDGIAIGRNVAMGGYDGYYCFQGMTGRANLLGTKIEGEWFVCCIDFPPQCIGGSWIATRRWK